MYTTNTVTISRNMFHVACGLAVLIFIALLWCLLQLDSKPAGRSEYDDVSASPETVFLPVIKADGTVEYFNSDRSRAKACGKLEGGQVEGDCKIGGDWISLNTITIVATKSGPGCINVYDGAGNLLFRKHNSGTYMNKHPCHAGNNPPHLQ